MILFIFLIGVTIFTRAAAQSITEKIVSTHLYKMIAIHSVDDFKTGENKLFAKKIIIQAVIFKPNPSKNRMIRNMHPMIPVYGHMDWIITGNDLPVSESDCREIDSLLCSEYLSNNPNQSACYKPCIILGPEFLAFDEKAGKLYLTAETAAGGNAGWPLLSFVADIQKKEIKPLKLVNGPTTAYLSPSGTYIALLDSTNYVTILNTNTNEEFTIQLANRNKNFIHLSNFHWVDDDNFKYDESQYHDRFQKSLFSIHQDMLNIKTRRIEGCKS